MDVEIDIEALSDDPTAWALAMGGGADPVAEPSTADAFRELSLLAYVRTHEGCSASEVCWQIGERLSPNVRSKWISSLRRAGKLAPSEPGKRYGRLYLPPAIKKGRTR